MRQEERRPQAPAGATGKATEPSTDLPRSASLVVSIIATLFPAGADLELVIKSAPLEPIETIGAIRILDKKGMLVQEEHQNQKIRLHPKYVAEFRVPKADEDLERTIPVAIEVMRERLATGYRHIYALGHPELTREILDDLTNVVAMLRLAVKKNIAVNVYDLTVQVALYARAAGSVQETVLEWMGEAIVYFAQSRKKELQARVTLELGHLLRGIPDLEAAETCYQAAYKLSVQLGDGELAAIAALRLADVLRMRARYGNAMAACKLSKAQMETLPSAPRLLQADLLETVGDVERSSGLQDEAILKYENAKEIYSNLERGLVGKVNILHSIGDILVSRGNHLEALQNYRLSLATSELIGDYQGRWNAELGLANVQRLEKEYARADAGVEAVMKAYLALGDQLGYGNALLLKCRIAYDTGGRGLALDYGQKSKEAFDRVGCRLNSAIADVEISKIKNTESDSALVKEQVQSFALWIGRGVSLAEIQRWPLEKKGSILLTTEIDG